MQNKIVFFNIDTNNGISVKYGTIDDSKHTSVILVRCKGRVKAINKQINYDYEVNLFKDKFESEVNKQIHNLDDFYNDYFLTIDLSNKSINSDRYSFIKYDLYLKPTESTKIEDYKDSISEFCNIVNNYLIFALKDNFILKN